MKIWKKITKKIKEIVAIKCDECSKSLPETARTLFFDVFILIIGDAEYHFCNWKCLSKFASKEENKLNPRANIEFGKEK